MSIDERELDERYIVEWTGESPIQRENVELRIVDAFEAGLLTGRKSTAPHLVAGTEEVRQVG